MTLPYINGVNLIPASGEFTYDTVAYSGAYQYAPFLPVNTYHAPGGSRTDLMYALDQLQEQLPNCQFVALVVQWMGDSLDASQCKLYPSSTYLNGAFEPTFGGTDSWRVSDITLATPGIIPISKPDGVHSAYGGTPSDQSVVRCLQEIKRRGLKVALYLQMNMDAPGQPWRGMCTYTPDLSQTATNVVNAFLGSAQTSDFSPDSTNLTVHYSGDVLDFTYRRFALHYAFLCTLAGGVNLFTIGSELRGLESIRGPNWTAAGTLDGNGFAVWDYPFVVGLQALANDCRSVFDAAGLTKNLAARQNLIAYSADWSQWMGAQHVGITGVFPHLDPLFAQASVDFVSFDNYLPLSDWTTGTGGLDALNWRAPKPTSWPTASPQTLGFGLTSTPQLHDLTYLKANVEGGEKADYYYGDYVSSQGLDPNGSDLIVTCPQGDRLAQARNRYYPGQELFAFKKLRWWWNNPHRAVYDSGDGQGAIPRGANTAWVAQSKSIGFMEYGFPSIDRSTNEENLFYDPGSVAGGTPFWCTWQREDGALTRPIADDTIQYLAHQTWIEYWTSDGNNETSGAGVEMIATDLMFAWTWDARPFPEFPLRTDIWSDGGNWRAGHWLTGKGPASPPLAPSPAPGPGIYASFPTLAGLGWSSRLSPRFASDVLGHASGRSSRRPRFSTALYDIELTYEVLRADPLMRELQTIAGFFEQMQGQASPFWVAPPGLTQVSAQALGAGDGATTVFPLVRSFGGYTEPVQGTSGVTAVYLNGVAVDPSAYSVSSGYSPTIVFATAPAPGAAISAAFGLLFLCRFSDDLVDLEEFMTMLFALRTVKLQSVRQ